MNFSVELIFSTLQRFFTWWRTELLALVPARLRQFSIPKTYLVLTLDHAERATLSVERPDGVTPLGEIEQTSGPAGQGALQSLLRQPEISGLLAGYKAPRCLRLPTRCGLCRAFDLPLAAESNLRQVIGYELDRYTPFRPEQVYFTYRVLGRDTQAEQLSVEVAVVPRPTLEEALKTSRGLGWFPDRIDLADPGSPAGHSDNLVQPAASSGDWRGRLTYRLAAVAIVLAVVALAIPFVATQRRAARVEQELQAVRQQARAAIAVQEKLQGLRDDENFLNERKRKSPSISQLLADTTHILPDDTWLVELRVDGTDAEFAGVTASASALIGILERSGVFRETAFRSPVVPDPGSGEERFDIAAHIVTPGR